MRYGYWWIEGLLGVLLIIAPFVEHFRELRVATYTDVILGFLLVIWALVGYLYMGEMKAQSPHPTHA